MKALSLLLSIVLLYPTAVAAECTLASCPQEDHTEPQPQQTLSTPQPQPQPQPYNSACNVEGNLFNLYAKRTPDDTNTAPGTVNLKQTGDLGTDTLAHFSQPGLTHWGVFYINKANNNRLITLDPFAFLNAANAYLDSPDGGELKFTFYNDTGRPGGYYWPRFDVVDRWLTMDGRRDVFGYCPFRAEYVTTGRIVAGEAGIAMEGCRRLEGLMVLRVTSTLSQE
ncbi:hypothetical protein BJY00DRAFT_281908 [Aspergillus carlsbadensis]|nr:hypothetical protein BJY00DRAFT_281908 [Aspergillus carlsbadensis]